MRRRIRRYVNPKLMLVLAVILVAVAIMVASKLDYAVMQHAPFTTGQQQQSEIYGFWFSSTMVMFGVILAVALGVVYESVVLGITVVASTAILLFGNFEDCMYFALGQGYFPANSTNWQWMWQSQSSFFGFWNTPDQILWTIMWVGLVLPIVVYVGLTHLKSY